MAKKPRGYYSQNEHRRSIQYRNWRKAVLHGSLFTCDTCGYSDFQGKKLQAHHLESYSENEELRTDISNGICVCVECHKKFHKIYGKKTTKAMYEEFKAERS